MCPGHGRMNFFRPDIGRKMSVSWATAVLTQARGVTGKVPQCRLVTPPGFTGLDRCIVAKRCMQCFATLHRCRTLHAMHCRGGGCNDATIPPALTPIAKFCVCVSARSANFNKRLSLWSLSMGGEKWPGGHHKLRKSLHHISLWLTTLLATWFLKWPGGHDGEGAKGLTAAQRH